MKTTFIQPRFTGRRFDEHTLPVEVTRDLAALESLVMDLAKQLFLLENPDRKRVPKGFSSDFQLHLERIDGGSAQPVLAWVTAGVLAASSGYGIYFEQAKDLIAECIAAPDGALPAKFPKDLLIHFNQFGRSLHEDESVEIPRAGGGVATLTPERRKRLVLAAQRDYEREVELAGSIAQVDWENATFRVRLADGSQATVPMQGQFNEVAREIGGKQRHQVVVRGIATLDSSEKVQRIESVESIEIQRNVALATRLEELGSLEDGWYDGDGKGLNKQNLSQFSERLVDGYPDSLALPLVAPTQDGNLLLEWNTAGAPSIDFDLQTLVAEFHAFDSRGNDIEQSFILSDNASWESFWTFLQLHIGEQA